jgi:hypothetical protein
MKRQKREKIQGSIVQFPQVWGWNHNISFSLQLTNWPNKIKCYNSLEMLVGTKTVAYWTHFWVTKWSIVKMHPDCLFISGAFCVLPTSNKAFAVAIFIETVAILSQAVPAVWVELWGSTFLQGTKQYWECLVNFKLKHCQLRTFLFID